MIIKFHILEQHIWDIFSLIQMISDLVSHKTPLADTLPDEEPAGHLSDNHSVHSYILHRGLSPLKCDCVLGEVAQAPKDATYLPRPWRTQLYFGISRKVRYILQNEPLPSKCCFHESHAQSLVEVN